MLTPQEALMFQAVKDEQARQQQADIAAGTGATLGALLGVGAGVVPQALSDALGSLRRQGKPKPAMNRLKPGFRMAGGLTGMILGGGLGAGTAALMKQESPAAQLLGKIQANGGQLEELDKIQLSRMLGQIYNEPSQLM